MDAGVDPPVAARIARAAPLARVREVITLAARRWGRLRNAAGFIVHALREECPAVRLAIASAARALPRPSSRRCGPRCACEHCMRDACRLTA